MRIGIGISPVLTNMISGMFGGRLPAYTFGANFLDAPGKIPGFSYTRATVGAMVQQYDGSFVQPIISEIPKTGGRRVQNLLSESEDFSTWTQSATTGATTAVHANGYKVIPGTSASTYHATISPSPYISIVTGLVYDVWFDIDAAEYTACAITVPASQGRGWFNLSTQASSNAGGSNLSTSVVENSDGSFRCTLTFTATTTSSVMAAWLSALPTYQDPSVSFSGDGTSGIIARRGSFNLRRPGQTIPDPEYISNGVEILGDELVTNGTFDSAATGWVDAGGTGSIAATAGAGVVTSGAGTGGVYRVFNVGAGVAHRVTWKSKSAAANAHRLRLYNATVGVPLSSQAYESAEYSGTIYQDGTTTVTPTGSLLTVYLRNSAAGISEWDDISVKPIVHHGFGVDGVKWFSTDEYGTDLTVEDALGPELWGDIGAPAVENFSGSSGSYIDGLLTNLGGLGTGNASYPRFTWTLPSGSSGKTFRCDFIFSSSVASVSGVRLSNSGSDYSIPEVTYGVRYTGDATCSSIEKLQINIDGTLGDNPITIVSASVREIYPVRCTGMARRPAITNLLTYSNDLSNAAWTKTGTVTAVLQSDNVSWLLSSTATFESLQRVVTVSNTTDYTISFLVSSATNGNVTLRMASGTSDVRKLITLSTGVVADAGGNGTDYISAGATAVGNGVYRVYLTATTNGTSLTINLYPDDPSVSGATSCLVKYSQLETGAVANDPVPTTTTAVTVNAEVPALVPATIGYDQDGGVWVVEHTAQRAASVEANNQVVLGVLTDSSNRYLLYNQSSYLGVYMPDGGVAQWSATSSAATWTVGQTQTIALRVEENDGEMVVDGVSRLTDAAMTIPAITTINLGGTDIQLYAGAFSKLYYWPPGTLTDEQLLYLSAGNLPTIPVLA